MRSTAPNSLRVLSVFALLAGTGAPAHGQAEHAFLGVLHSHTSYSDGSGLPAEAYEQARTLGHCDFFAITEHNHAVRINPKAPRVGKQPIGGDPALYNGPGNATSSIHSAANATTSSFVALYGQEFSTISSGNHACVFDAPAVIKAPSGQFDKLAAWLGEPDHRDSTNQTPIVQFNHPSSQLRKQGIEYGADDFHSRAEWIKTMGALACTIEILNGPGLSQQANRPVPRPFEGDYRYYLSLGFRLAPTGDQDNHYRTWGTLTTVRTGIVAPELTKPALLKAIRERHVYATSDSNLRVIGRADGHLFGDVLPPPAVGTPVSIALEITDGDEPQAAYRVQVFDGEIGGDPATASPPLPDFAGNGEHQLQGPEYRDTRQYFFLRIRQTNKDGTFDTVWTAPVWFADPLSFASSIPEEHP